MSSNARSSLERDYYIHAGLSGAAILPLLIIWIVPLWIVRTRKDPARVAFIWLKLLFPVYLATLGLTVASDIIHASRVYLDANSRRNPDYVNLNVTSATTFLGQVADSLLLVTFIELGNGFIFSINRERSSSQKAMRWLAVFLAVALVAVTLAQLILQQDLIPKMWRAMGNYQDEDFDDSVLEDLANKAMAVEYLAVGYAILNRLTSAFVPVYACVVTHKYSAVKACRGCAAIFLSASVLNFIRLVWLMASNISLRLTYTFLPDNTTWQLLDIFLNIWAFCVVLALLFSIAVKKDKGLWTISQPWMSGVSPAFVERAQSVDRTAPLKT
ncbi:hypothetical protein AK830_g3848 [Neonectria ditissima]|uniref:Uncharacterized protein n=1 Tax=Neonectria ditissima TaxID=78410 RepID=A0A0N8H7T6_9HYPO|nr:hypothetical protein AK830_g3848 [Neonectria ditissima]